MNRSIQLGLKAGERLYVNGAVIRVDRKVSIELLNDVAFLLEAHVMQAGDTTTPLRQLYFVIQTMLIDPANRDAVPLFEKQLALLLGSFENRDILDGLAAVETMVASERLFDALKTVRSLFSAERRIILGLSVEPEPASPTLRLVTPPLQERALP